MRYKLLGRSGLRVAEMSLGTMTFGTDWGWGADAEECKRIFDTYVEAGGNFIDTANYYTNGSAEKIVADLIQGNRDYFVLSTKYTLPMHKGDPNAGGNHRKSMAVNIEQSLKRLKTDYIDLYWLHAWDFLTPMDEILRGLDDLVRAGKVLYIGISDTPAWVISRMNTLADFHGWTPFTAIQAEYNLLSRTPERDLFPMARHMDLAIMTWGALASGVLTGKFNVPREERGEDYQARVDRWGGVDERALTIAGKVIEIAERIGATPSQVALAWVHQQPGVVIPLLGARKASHIADNLKCLEVTLSDDDMAALDEISHTPKGFPHDFLASAGNQNLIYGGLRPQIDNHRPE
jgi:aryl-alcohol dehydrogenase-like predicted oxidoreductase